MAEDSRSRGVYEFGPFRLEVDEWRLLRNGIPISLTPKVLETLVLLVENSGKMVHKDELMSRLWPDRYVEEANLKVNISQIRKALGPAPDGGQYIETIAKRGYRFIGEARLVDSSGQLVPPPDPASESVTDSAGMFDASRRFGAVLNRKLLWIAALGVLLMAIIGYWRFSRPPRTGSIAVLPFRLLSGESDDEALESGMADALITRLGNLEQVVVRPTGSVLRYGGVENDPVSAGRELRVDAVLEGRVQRSGDRVRVTAQLLSVADGKAIWSGKFEESFTGIFSVQDSISERIAEALSLELSQEQRTRLSKHHTEDPGAYLAYIKGRHHWNKRTPEGLKKAIDLFQEAIDLDPAYALAYSGLAETYGVLGTYYMSPNDVYPKARAAAAKAIDLDDSLVEAYTTLGAVRLVYDWDWAGAERELKHAIQLNPNYSDAHQLYGWYLVALARLNEAERELTLAQQLDPLSPPKNRDVGAISFWARRYDEAVNQFRSALDLEPGFFQYCLWLGQSYEQKGMFDEAIHQFEKALTLSPENPLAMAGLGHAYAASARPGQARQVIDSLKNLAAKQYVSPVNSAIIHAGIGEQERALELLEQAYKERAPALIFIKVEPRWDNIRSDPRFAGLIDRMGLPH